jgi:hypothetical protein
MNDYQKGPLVTTSAGRKVWSFDAYLEECYARCGEKSSAVLELANAEWMHGHKNVETVRRNFTGRKT